MTQSPFRDRYPSLPPLRPRTDMFLVLTTSIYQVEGITRTLLLFYAPEIVPCSLVRSTTTDFRISQYSSTHIFYFFPGIFFVCLCLSSILHSLYIPGILYRTYPYVLEYYNFLHTWYIYTWYIRTAVYVVPCEYVVPCYHTTYDIYSQYLFSLCATDVYLVAGMRVCLNFIRLSWNGWNGTRLFVVVRSIPTCFQVFVSVPTTKRKSWNSCALSAIGNILDCQYKTLGDAQAAGRMPRAHACTTPITPFPILET